MSWVTGLARPAVTALAPYQTALWEPRLTRLHANELPWRAAADESSQGLNRYPEPQSRALIARLADLYGVDARRVVATRGSDEGIDLLVRAFCECGRDAVLICPPTFGMYAQCAQIQGAQIICVPLRAAEGFALDGEGVMRAWTPRTKLIFLCSPNNPTGNLLDREAVLILARIVTERTLVVIDEAYLEFAGTASLAREIAQHPNLVILRTLSKAHGLAGARCGAVIAHPEVAALLRKIIQPYAIPQLTVEAVLRILGPLQRKGFALRTRRICAERSRISQALRMLPPVRHVWPSAANFLLAEFTDATEAMRRARAAHLLVRDVRNLSGLPRALRITLGTREQNNRLLQAWA